MTDRYAVIGNPVAHSRSPGIHTLFAQQAAQDMHYEAILAPLDGFAAAVHTFIADGGHGLNVTMPFKAQAYRIATRCSPRAEAAGAVNTLCFKDKEIFGDNTDGAGLVRDIEFNLRFPVAGQRVLLLGAGGAARGCILPLLDRSPASLVIANRSVEKSILLASIFSSHVLKPTGCGFTELAGQTFDLVINATSAGLDDAALPLPPGLFASDGLAYEMVYGKDTAFLAQARNAGIRMADGRGMLVEQAAESFLLWRGVRPDTAQALTLQQLWA